MKAIETKNAPAPIGPYNQAIQTENMLFVSGQIAINAESGELIIDDIVSETHQVMKNLQAILEEAELSFDSVVKTSIFVKDLQKKVQHCFRPAPGCSQAFFRKGFVREGASDQLHPVCNQAKSFREGFVREGAWDQLQSEVFRSGFVIESASDQLHSLIKPSLKG